MASAGNRSSNNTRRSADRRLKYLDREMARHSYNQSGLLEILFKAHAMFGHLPIDILRYIAMSLRIAPSRVYATASFYSQFSLRPGPEVSVHICNGVTCLLNGADKLMRTLQGAAGHAAGMRCSGLCGLGPIADVHGATVVHATAESVAHALAHPQHAHAHPQPDPAPDGGAA